MELSSEKRVVNYPIERVFTKVSNFENLRAVVNERSFNGFSIEVLDEDRCSLQTGFTGNVLLEITHRQAPNLVCVTLKGSPIDGKLSLVLSSNDLSSTELQVKAEGDVPVFVRAMVSKPLGEALNKLVDLLSQIPYV